MYEGMMFARVTWHDSYTEMGWQPLTLAKMGRPSQCQSMGFVVDDDPNSHITLAQSHGEGNVNGLITIPYTAITQPVEYWAVDGVKPKARSGHEG